MPPTPPTTPDRATVDETVKVITDHAPRIFSWTYERDRPQLVTLYNKAMASQWNSVTDLDWSIDVDPERMAATQADPNPVRGIAREAAKIKGSPLASWGERELDQLGVEILKAQLSQFMHGEQGAMMVAAKIVETVPWIDAKYYAATQTMDEARHTEVFARYLHEKLGDPYPMSPFLETQITALVEDPRWDVAYLGMQIVIESLALAAFGGMLKAAEEPLLRKLLRYVMSDEARHVAFGVLSLREYYADLPEAELKDRQDLLLEATIHNRSRSTTPEVWARMGVDVKAVVPYLKEAAAGMGSSVDSGFVGSFYAKLVPNVRKLGLLDANDGYLRERWGAAGLLRFEEGVDTAEDYDANDAVATDRAATATA
jgi:hypothetical protein